MNRAILIVAGLISASSLLLVDSAIKGMALLLLAAVVALVSRRDSAATRHMVWQLAIVALLVVPLLSAILPQWRVLPAWARLPTPAAVVELPPTTVAELPSSAPGGVERSESATAPSESENQAVFAPVDTRPALEASTVVAASTDTRWDWRMALAILWSFGFVVLMLRLAAARSMLWNIERNGISMGLSGRAVEADGDPIYAALEEARLQLGIVRPVMLLIHSDRTIPVVWGIVRCRLLLPSTARLWNGEQLRSVMLHELAHVRRCDALGQLLTQIACAVHWFNPLVWFAAWRLGVERERACDDLVLASGVRASAYAGHLLEVVTESGPSRCINSGALAMARKSSLEGRMVAVLSEKMNRRRVSLALLGFALAIAVGIAVPLAMLRAADQSSKEKASIKVVEEPRTATVSGNYELGDKVRLVVSQVAGDSFAAIHFLEPEAEAARPAPPHRIALPEGRGEFVFAWTADSGELWLMRKSEKFLWRYRYNASELKEEGRFDLWPLTVLSTPLRRALQDALGLREPQDLPPLGDEGLETPESGPGPTKAAKLRLGTEERIAWGQPANGLRAALVRLPPEIQFKAGAVVDLNVVVQNVSDTPIRLRGGSPAAFAVLKTVDADGKELPVENGILDILSTIDEFEIAPREVAVMSLMSVGIGKHDVNSQSIQGRAIGYWTGESRTVISNETFKGSISFADAPEGYWEGTLNFGALKVGGKSEVDSNAATSINQTQSKARLPKVPDKSYTKVGVHYQKFREEDAKHPGGELMGDVLNPRKDVDGPLVLGLRVASDAKWDIGGEARVELVVRNQSNDDVKFAQTPRSDNGLSVVAIDKDGKQHQAEIAQFDGLLTLNHLLLPKDGYAVRVKSFTVRFDAAKRDTSEPNVATFHLPPGDYTLRCNWRDAHPEVSHEGEWTGELTSADCKFTLASATTSQAQSPKSPSSELPKATELGKPIDWKSAPKMSWGEAKEGLRGALRIIGELRAGQETKAELWVRNSNEETVKFSWTNHADVGLDILTTDGSKPARETHMTRGKTEFQLYFLALPPEKAVKLKEFTIRLGSPPTAGPVGIVSLSPTPGDWTLQGRWTDTLHLIEGAKEWRGELHTAKITLRVTSEGAAISAAGSAEDHDAPANSAKPPSVAPDALKTTEQEPYTAWGEEVNGVQIGIQLSEQRIYRVGENATLILRLRNNGKVQVPYRDGDEYFLKNPPRITDTSGKAVTIKAMSVFGFVRLNSVAPGKEVDLVHLKLDLQPATVRSKDEAWTLYGTGKFQIEYPVTDVVGEVRPDLPGMNLTTGKLELEVKEPEKMPPEKETPTGPSNTADEPAKPKPNYVTVVGQLLDDETGLPIEKAGWEWGMADPKKPAQISWGHSRSMGGKHPGGKFEMLLNIGANGHHYPLRVHSAGYETTIVVDELAKPYPEKIERIVRLKRGRNITGVLRDHTGKPVANGWVFFIPKGHQTNIVESIPGTDAHHLPVNARDGAVAEVRTNENGTFALSTGAAGTLAASTDLVDLWPFPLPEDGYAELKMPAPSYLVIDLTYWYLDELAKKGKHAFSPDSEDPNQCWIQVDQSGSTEPLWKNLGYRRQMLVFAKDPRAKLSKGVIVGHVVEGEMDKPIPDVGHNKNLSTKIRVALPPGNYRVQRLRTGPFAPVDEQNVELKSGEDTILSWARGDGSSVRGKATWPANMMFVRQQGEAPRKLDWTVPYTATVWIAPVGADGEDGKPIDAAKIQSDGSFFVPTNLDPGKYKATARVSLPESDDSRRSSRELGPDCIATAEFTVPDPARGPFGSPPVELEIKMEVGENVRFLRSNALADPPHAVQPPAGKAKEPFTAWGKEVGGLQAGLGFKADEKEVYQTGETVDVVLRVRNVGKADVKFSYFREEFLENPPIVTDEAGKSVPLEGAGFGGEPRRIEVNLTPGKQVDLSRINLVLRPASERGNQKPVWKLFGTGKFQLQRERVAGNFEDKVNGGPDPILSKLGTGKLEFEIKPVAPVEQETPKPKSDAMLKPETEQKLKWGEPVNGLRAALVLHPVPDQPDAEDRNDIFLAVQNMTQEAIRLHASDVVPNPRRLIWRDKGVLETVNETAQPIPADFQLSPREVALFRVCLPPGTKNRGGRSTGSLIAESIQGDTNFSLEGTMEITKAPAGAWSGKLVSGRIEGGTAIPVVAPADDKPPSDEAPQSKAKNGLLKLTPDALLGTWRGKVNEEKLMLSFHRPPVEKDVQLDIYFGEAKIGALAGFSIADDGGSAAVVQHSAGGGMAFGTLIPAGEGKLKLELYGRQQGQMEVMLTLNSEPAETEPQQKEARELFEMWKNTANDDGTIPGTFIGMLAEEVRAYVKSNPNLNSGMELPKLLPRFVTSRDWTAKEAIELLDDVAFYSTAPIEARIAKAKLPSGALWRTMVSYEDIPVKIANWSDTKEGLRIGIRVVEADWRLGGKAKLELWLHNSGEKDLSFMTSGPDRQDAGIAVCATDADGREHWAANGNVSIIAIPLNCTLPAGHVAKVRDLTVSFDAPDNKELAWFAQKFRDLAAGKYKLRCLWADAQPSLSSTGQWTGELTTNELEFELGREVK